MSLAGMLIGGIAGGLANGISGVTNTAVQGAINATEAQKQRDWQELMSNTSFQRAVADMEKAGVNPAMLYQSGGQGASTPSGASAKVSNPNIDILGGAGEFINSITNARRVDAITKTNEMSRKQANQLYQTALNITKNLY